VKSSSDGTIVQIDPEPATNPSEPSESLSGSRYPTSLSDSGLGPSTLAATLPQFGPPSLAPGIKRGSDEVKDLEKPTQKRLREGS
jgi:hypothetical protein